jgi:hypothetical protein
VLTWVSGECYKSLFKNERQVGPVTFTNTRGDKYEGEWRDDKPNGNGKMFYANGNQYIVRLPSVLVPDCRCLTQSC